MDPITVQVDIDHGRLTARQPHLLPETGTGLLTVMAPAAVDAPPRGRVRLPIIRCVPGTTLDPTPEELDESLWG